MHNSTLPGTLCTSILSLHTQYSSCCIVCICLILECNLVDMYLCINLLVKIIDILFSNLYSNFSWGNFCNYTNTHHSSKNSSSYKTLQGMSPSIDLGKEMSCWNMMCNNSQLSMFCNYHCISCIDHSSIRTHHYRLSHIDRQKGNNCFGMSYNLILLYMFYTVVCMKDKFH